MPWQGRFSAYAVQGGMLIPMAGELAFVFADGPRVYWRGRAKQAEFKLAA
ncbi:MAG: hypothetical protein JWQ13_788 [Ramlibacter sp.]|nr:hypothetical protein [Ramlibacter sp.]